MITQQELEDMTGLIARRAVTLFASFDQDRIDATQDLVKAILKNYIIIKINKDETDIEKS